jgi:hypothetical protein
MAPRNERRETEQQLQGFPCGITFAAPEPSSCSRLMIANLAFLRMCVVQFLPVATRFYL